MTPHPVDRCGGDVLADHKHALATHRRGRLQRCFEQGSPHTGPPVAGVDHPTYLRVLAVVDPDITDDPCCRDGKELTRRLPPAQVVAGVAQDQLEVLAAGLFADERKGLDGR